MLMDLLRNAGPFAFMNVAVGAFGLLLAVAALATGKSTAAKVLGVLCLVGALAALSLGFLGFFVGMEATNRALANVPDDMRDQLLRKGTEESRGNLVVALAAALLPLLGGVVASLRTAFRPGMVLGACVVIASAAMGAQLAKPLPPLEPPVAEPPGLTLARSTSPRELRGAALVALTPDGLWANGARVSSLSAALEEPLVKERSRGTLSVLIDSRVKFSALADLMEAAEKNGRGTLQLVVLSPAGERHIVTVTIPPEEPEQPGRPELKLTVRVTATEFHISAVGGALPAMPADAMALNEKLAEVKASFPDVDTITMTADPELPFAEFVKALDAAALREKRLLFPRLIVVR